jgi:hypothetical protein
MTIRKSEHEVILTSEECYTIAYNIFDALQKTVKEHWVNHPDAWRDREKERIQMMTTFFNLSNYGYLVEYQMRTLDEIIKNANTPKQ